MKQLDLSSRKNMFYWQTNRNISAEKMKKIFLDRSMAVDVKEMRKAIEYGMGRKVVWLSKLITDGLVNNVVRARLADKTEVIMRAHPKNVINGYFWAESMAAKKALSKGVITYKTHVIVDDKKKFDFDFMIMEALAGETMRNFTQSGEIEYQYEEQLIKQTGKQVGLIHQVKPKGFGFFINSQAKKGKLEGQYKEFKQHIYAALEKDLAFLIKMKTISKKQRQTIKKIFKQGEKLMQGKQGVLIHNDVADWNTLSDGKKVTGIIDWDECISADPMMEFAAYNLFFGEPRMSWFKQGYQETNALPDQFEEKLQLFKLRYLVSKLGLRVKMATVHDSSGLQRNIKRGYEAMKEVFLYFKVS